MQSLNVLFTGVNRVEVYEEPIRELRDNEVLVQNTKTLISTGTECICLSRAFDAGTHWDHWVRYPFRPGYSAVGRVIAVGEKVKTLREGDRVASRANHRQYVLLSEAEALPVPKGITDDDATWFHLATIVQNGIRRAEHQLGEAVVVVGLGLLGQLVTQYLRLLGAREIIAVDPVQRRLEMARMHGATITLAMGALEARETVLGLTEGQGVDVVYDVTGAAPVFPDALRLLRRFGRLILLGDTGSPTSQRLTPDVITKGLRIIGADDNNPPPFSTDHAYWSHQRMTELFFTYLLRNVMRVSDLVTHRYTPTDAPEAYRMLREERATAMGVLFDWTQI